MATRREKFVIVFVLFAKFAKYPLLVQWHKVDLNQSVIITMDPYTIIKEHFGP